MRYHLNNDTMYRSLSITVYILDANLTTLISMKPMNVSKVRKRAKIRNRYNQAPHLTQESNGKVTMSQLDISGQPFPSR